ncbi:MAG: PAS domain-containing protein, partial [bacterium]
MRLFASLRSRLILLVLVVIVPILVLILYTHWDQRLYEKMEAGRDAIHAAQVVTDLQHRVIEKVGVTLKMLAQFPAVQRGDVAASTKLFQELLEKDPLYVNIGLIAPDGHVVSSALPSSPTLNAADRSYFRDALEKKGFAIGEYQIGRIAGVPTINFAYPVLGEDGSVMSVVFVAIKPSWVSRVAAATDLPNGSAIWVLDRRGVVLGQYPEPDKWSGKSVAEVPIVKLMMTRHEGVEESVGPDGRKAILGFSHLHCIGCHGGGGPAGNTDSSVVAPRLHIADVRSSFFVCVGIPTAAAFAHLNAALRQQLAVVGILLIVSLGLAWVIGEVFIRRGVNDLLLTTEKLAIGDFSARTSRNYRVSELSQLARGFNRMADSIEGKTAQLLKAENRFRSLVENIPAVTFTGSKDEIGKFYYVSPQIEELAGFAPEEWVSNPQLWARQTHPLDRQRVAEELIRYNKEGKPWRGEFRMNTKSGKEIWLRVQTCLIPNETGDDTHMLGAVMDITDRVRAEEALVESLRAHSTLLSNLPGMAYRCRNDKDWTMELVSDGCLELTGYRPADLLLNARIGYAQITHPDDREVIRQKVQTTVSEKASFQLLYRIVTAAGQEKWVWDQGRPAFAADGSLLALEGYVADITPRRKAEQKVEQQLERLEALRNVDRAISGTLDMRIVLNVILDQVTSQLKVDAACILLLQHDTGIMSYAAGRGFHTRGIQTSS